MSVDTVASTCIPNGWPSVLPAYGCRILAPGHGPIVDGISWVFMAIRLRAKIQQDLFLIMDAALSVLFGVLPSLAGRCGGALKTLAPARHDHWTTFC